MAQEGWWSFFEIKTWRMSPQRHGNIGMLRGHGIHPMQLDHGMAQPWGCLHGFLHGQCPDLFGYIV